MSRMLRYTLTALRRGTVRRGESITVVEGSDFDLEHREDPAWTRTVMHAIPRREGPVPDQRAQVAYQALIAFMAEQAVRVRELGAEQRRAYRTLLAGTDRELVESFEVVFTSLPELDEDTEFEAESGLEGDTPHPVTELELGVYLLELERAAEAGEVHRLQHERELWEAVDGADGRDEALARIASLLETNPGDGDGDLPPEVGAPSGPETAAQGAGDDLGGEGGHLDALLSLLEDVAEARDTNTTIEALVAKAREHGITVPETLPRRRVDVANRLLDLATEPPPTAPSAADLGDA